MNIVEKNIIRALLKNGHAMEKRRLVMRLPIHLQPKAPQSILQLAEAGYLIEDFTEKGWIVSIPKFMVQDALKSISSIYARDY